MDIQLKCSKNFEVINGILRHESIYPNVSDDGTPPPMECDVTDSAMVFVLIYSDAVLAGLYALQFHSSVMLEIHTCILPEFRGKCAAVAAKRIIEWVFKNTPCEKLITLVPAFNRAALLYALCAGLKKEGCITKSFKSGGVLHDQTLLGINKENALCLY